VKRPTGFGNGLPPCVWRTRNKKRAGENAGPEKFGRGCLKGPSSLAGGAILGKCTLSLYNCEKYNITEIHGIFCYIHIGKSAFKSRLRILPLALRGNVSG
jgi:hypothetical protein